MKLKNKKQTHYISRGKVFLAERITKHAGKSYLVEIFFLIDRAQIETYIHLINRSELFEIDILESEGLQTLADKAIENAAKALKELS